MAKVKLSATAHNADAFAHISEEVHRTRRAIQRLGNVIKRQAEKIDDLQQRLCYAREAAKGYLLPMTYIVRPAWACACAS
jgi:hypothetical protein